MGGLWHHAGCLCPCFLCDGDEPGATVTVAGSGCTDCQSGAAGNYTFVQFHQGEAWTYGYFPSMGGCSCTWELAKGDYTLIITFYGNRFGMGGVWYIFGCIEIYNDTQNLPCWKELCFRGCWGRQSGWSKWYEEWEIFENWHCECDGGLSGTMVILAADLMPPWNNNCEATVTIT